MTLKRFLLGTCVVTGSAGGLAGARGDILIDTFSDANAGWPSSAKSPFIVGETGLSGTYNGRRLHLWDFLPLPNGGSANVVDDTANSYLQFTGDSSLPQFHLMYNGAPDPGLDLNLPISGPVTVTLNFLNITIPSSQQLIVTAAVTMDINSEYGGYQSSEIISTGGPESLILSVPTHSLKEVDGVDITLQGGAGVSVQLDSITLSVPEPGSLLMLGIGAAGVVSRRRR